MAVIFVGRDAGDEGGLAADENGVGKAEAHALNHDGAAGGGQARGRDGVGIENPAVVGVVGAAVAALVGDADADHVVTIGGDAEPGFAGGQAVDAGSRADGGCADGVKGVPDADGGHGFGFGGRASLVEGLGDDGEDAIAADGEGEPVGLADLAEAAGPQSAGGQGARLSLACRWRPDSRRRRNRTR